MRASKLSERDYREGEIIAPFAGRRPGIIRRLFPAAGDYLVQARATDIRGHSQPENDPDPANGTDEWPALTVKVKK
jgi:hypothetical protein